MDLTGLLLRIAARRPHVLVVAIPGAIGARLALEAALARRGWPVAASPADADVVAVAGAPGPQLAAVVDALWQQVPAPRARVVLAAHDVDERLDDAAALLADAAHERAAQPGRRDHAEAHSDDVEHEGHHDQPDHGGHDQHGGHESHGGHDQHGAHEHGGHGGGHHGHHMHGGAVAGLPMAELGPDRDGLTLDRLHVPLGPLLPDWPAGLVVRVTLQGDVVQEASAEVLDAGHVEPFEWPSPVARELDGLARFLGVAGWPSAAAQARRVRDAALAGEDVAAASAALARRVRGSRTLRWLLRGIPAGGTDVAALLASRLAAIDPGGSGRARPERGDPAGLGDLLVDAELAAARLVVAAADPDTDRVAAGHG